MPAWSLDWKLPVVTVRYEAAGGSSEDPDEDTFEPSSLRNTVSFRLKEEADPATFGLGLVMSAKDYYQQSGDYSYLKLEQDGSVRLGKPWKLGYALAAKWMDYPQLDSFGLPKDVLGLSAAVDAVLRLDRGTSLGSRTDGALRPGGGPRGRPAGLRGDGGFQRAPGRLAAVGAVQGRAAAPAGRGLRRRAGHVPHGERVAAVGPQLGQHQAKLGILETVLTVPAAPSRYRSRPSTAATVLRGIS